MDIHWCPQCRTPLYEATCPSCGASGTYMSTDATPVFPVERFILSNVNDDVDANEQTIWKAADYRYIVNGERLNITVSEIVENTDIDRLRKRLSSISMEGIRDQFDTDVRQFIRANSCSSGVRGGLKVPTREDEALEFIRDTVENRYSDHIQIVSFSGGKDSTITSHLVRRALGTNRVLHVFGDTTLETPFTYDYVDQFRENHPQIPFIRTNSEHDFFDFAEKIGPPSRVMSWCCTVFKTGPISQLFQDIADDRGILTFYGIRASESVGRSKYKKLERSPKISRQIVASPILHWRDMDVWLYLFAHSKELSWNEAYELGYNRVGCWPCPNNGIWSQFITQIHLPEHHRKWHEFLIRFAKEIGKPDPVEYVDEGGWKARQGGAGLDVGKYQVDSATCTSIPRTRDFSLTRPIDKSFYELFKPFGRLKVVTDGSLLNETWVVDKQDGTPIMTIRAREGSSSARITVAPSAKNFRLVSQRIDSQIRKFLACQYCGGCVGACPRNAIRVDEGKYVINEEECNSCGQCINHFDRGCLMSKVLQVRRA